MTNNDEKIKLLLSKVAKQKNDLGPKPKGVLLTNGIFKYRDGSHFNLNTVRDTSVLVEALASLIELEDSSKRASSRLGIESKTLMWDGYSINEWETDFKQRVEVIKWDTKKSQLDETKKKLDALISEDAKTAMELASIEDLLK